MANIYGTDSADYRNGTVQNDSIYTYAGNDTVYANDGDDYLYGFSGSDYLIGDAGDDTLYGDTGRDYLYGGDDNDRLLGNRSNDYLDGSDGYDFLDGGTGKDTLSGGPSADTFYYYNSSVGIDTITDFSSSEGDIIQVDNIGFGIGSNEYDALGYNNSTGALSVNGTVFAVLDPAVSDFNTSFMVSIV